MDALADKDTVSMYFVHAALAKLAAGPRQRALAVAGIPEPLLAMPQARVPAPAYSALWLAVARALDDEFFGLDRRAMKVGSFALLCQAVIGCESLERAIKRLLRGFSVFLDDVRGALRTEGGAAVVQVDNRIADAADRRFADETFLVLVHGLMCWLANRRLVLDRVDFAHPRPAHAREYALMYSQHVGFDAAATSIRFNAAALGWPVQQTPSSLQQFLSTAPQSVFLKYRNEDSWTARVRRHLRGAAQQGRWPVFDDIARVFDTAPTTLRRRLEAEGTTYQALKDQLRNDLAVDRLCHGAMSVDEIGVGLGFQDTSAFHRAFKRWNGVSPGEYRRRRSQAAL